MQEEQDSSLLSTACGPTDLSLAFIVTYRPLYKQRSGFDLIISDWNTCSALMIFLGLRSSSGGGVCADARI